MRMSILQGAGDRIALSAGLLLLAASAVAHAHGGGLNAEGCHTNRKTGEYHCHRGAPAGAPPRSQQLLSPSTKGQYGTVRQSGRSAADRLRDLQQLRDQGLLSPAEFDRKREEILKDL